MTTRKITIMALIAGIVLGAAATEGFNFYRQSHDSQIFQERLRCKAVADAYVKEENSTDPEHVFVDLEKVDYSHARNTCVAEVEKTLYASSGYVITETVQDLLSGETLFSTACTKDCEALRYMAEDAFDYVINNASNPLKLQETARAYMKLQAQEGQSKHPPKSAPPSGLKAERDQAKPEQGPWTKYQGKSAPPSGH